MEPMLVDAVAVAGVSPVPETVALLVRVPEALLVTVAVITIVPDFPAETSPAVASVDDLIPVNVNTCPD
jgi:hypothetical protein